VARSVFRNNPTEIHRQKPARRLAGAIQKTILTRRKGLRMKAIVRALIWATNLELLLLAPVVLGNYVQFAPFDIIFGVLPIWPFSAMLPLCIYSATGLLHKRSWLCRSWFSSLSGFWCLQRFSHLQRGFVSTGQHMKFRAANPAAAVDAPIVLVPISLRDCRRATPQRR